MRIEEIKERYLSDGLPKRLGALAANLSRLASFSSRAQNKTLLSNLLRESEYFIEWTALDMPPELQETLIDIQIQLARAAYQLSNGKDACASQGANFKEMSSKVLASSGLAV